MHSRTRECVVGLKRPQRRHQNNNWTHFGITETAKPSFFLHLGIWKMQIDAIFFHDPLTHAVKDSKVDKMLLFQQMFPVLCRMNKLQQEPSFLFVINIDSTELWSLVMFFVLIYCSYLTASGGVLCLLLSVNCQSPEAKSTKDCPDDLFYCSNNKRISHLWGFFRFKLRTQ